MPLTRNRGRSGEGEVLFRVGNMGKNRDRLFVVPFWTVKRACQIVEWQAEAPGPSQLSRKGLLAVLNGKWRMIYVAIRLEEG